MRCLTLADGLGKAGAQIRFVCRQLPVDSRQILAERGYELVVLEPTPQEPLQLELEHSHWLATTQQQDARACREALSDRKWDWLIVDHYALDYRWENELRSSTRRFMVIDDLVDRKHDCDLLLDQTFNRRKEEYRQWVPQQCVLLTGANYSLLRSEFKKMREYSLSRRLVPPDLGKLLITLGGIDKDNITRELISELATSSLPQHCQITFLMGRNAPWLDSVRRQAEKLPWQTHVKVAVHNIAELMAESDLAIGAAGSTAWERCCLGLPTILILLASNQKDIAERLDQAGSVVLIEAISEIPGTISYLRKHPDKLTELSRISSKITDGTGVEMVAREMVNARA